MAFNTVKNDAGLRQSSPSIIFLQLNVSTPALKIRTVYLEQRTGADHLAI